MPKESANVTSSSFDEGTMLEGSGLDVPKSVLRRIVASSQDDGSSLPLTTQAVRDLEKARKSRVYKSTLIKIKYAYRFKVYFAHNCAHLQTNIF
jgi:hypothetical protein